jgi:predicted dehydrogenase
MGRVRHLEGAILALRQSGVELELTLAGRSQDQVSALASKIGANSTANLGAALESREFDLFFDASSPLVRASLIAQSLNSGTGVYTEKPISLSIEDARNLHELSSEKKLFTAIVQDKLFTVGFKSARRALEENLIGEIYDIRCEFGYWVETGFDGKPINRPSWNFRKEQGGSLIPDLFSHWNYIIELVDRINSVSALTKTHVASRVDEKDQAFKVTIPDVAHVIFNTESGITGTITSSWVQRPLVPFTMRVFGSRGALNITPVQCLLESPLGQVDLVSKFGITPEDEFLSQWRDVINAVQTGKEVPFDFASALRQAEFCAAIEKSALDQSFVSVERVKK